MRYFVRDSYGPVVQSLPQQQTWGEQPNHSDDPQARQSVAQPEAAIAGSQGNYSQTPANPTTPGPERATVPTSLFAQPGQSMPTFREVIARYDNAFDKYFYYKVDGISSVDIYRQEKGTVNPAQYLNTFSKTTGGQFVTLDDTGAGANMEKIVCRIGQPTDLGRVHPSLDHAVTAARIAATREQKCRALLRQMGGGKAA